MKFYIASSFANKDKVREAVRIFKEMDWIHTYDWTANSRASSIDELTLYGELEKKAILEADFLVVLLPAGKGSHIEMGIAIGQGKPVYLISEKSEYFDFDVTSTFYHLPEVKILIGNWSESITKVQELMQQQ